MLKINKSEYLLLISALFAISLFRSTAGSRSLLSECRSSSLTSIYCGIVSLTPSPAEKDSPTNGQNGSSRSTTPVPSRSTTPRPPNMQDDSSARPGVLTVRVFSGRNLNLPPNTPLPGVIQQALASGAASQPQRSARESIQRKRSWWLPYVVIQFDKQEIMVDALGGAIDTPTWMYKAHL